MKMPEGIHIEFNADTTKMQLQLRAIAKHTEALADELKRINDDVCPECGSTDYVTVKAHGDDQGPIVISCACDECGYEMTSKGAAGDG